MNCIGCSSPIPSGADKCPTCSAPVDFKPKTKTSDEKYCHECGDTIRAKAEICPKCGVRQTSSSIPGYQAEPAAVRVVQGKSKTTAGILALFLGGFGFHKFYLDRPFQGILYLLLCWTFMPAIIAFVEGLNYLTMSDKVFDERYQ